MVFRKESRADSFQRQISALRQQLGADQEEDELFDDAEPMAEPAESMEAGVPPSPRPTPAPRVSATPTADLATGVIAADSVWSGTLRAQGSLRIFGTVEGDLAATDEIFVAEGAAINARVSARTVVVAGLMEGTVECSVRLEVLPTGRVNGDVTTPSLVVHDGATVEGELRMLAPERNA
jgi:cytoskeletal protein CcmA (bactofilin family)